MSDEIPTVLHLNEDNIYRHNLGMRFCVYGGTYGSDMKAERYLIERHGLAYDNGPWMRNEYHVLMFKDEYDATCITLLI